MPVEIPPQCKDVEPLVRYLEGKKFEIEEVSYNRLTDSCTIEFQHPEVRITSRLRSIPVGSSTINYNILDREYRITLSKVSRYPFSIHLFYSDKDVSKDVELDISVATYDNLQTPYLRFSNIKNPNVIKMIIDRFYGSEIREY